MCGIAAVFRDSTAEANTALVRGMCRTIVHRGPDDEGIHGWSSGAIGMRRLSIIDVAGGQQPIANEEKNCWIVFNGEIYNHHDLRDELLSLGHVFATKSDTETILHAWEEWGTASFARLTGMFAFVIWDTRLGELIVCRDRMGIKPLYVWQSGTSIAVGSELRTILSLPDSPTAIDDAAVAAYLAVGYIPAPGCIISGITKLPAAHFMRWRPRTNPRIEAFWDPASIAVVPMEADVATDQLRDLLTESVVSHLESEVPLGAFLSGGIDSSAVVSIMQRESSRRVQTFSIGFREAGYDESVHAAEVASALGTKHTTLIVDPQVDGILDDLILAFDEPFADSSALPTYLVSQLARSRVTVALSGDGGDELFAGYARYEERLSGMTLSPIARGVVGALARRLPHGALGRNRLLDLGREASARYAATVLQPLDVDEGGVASKKIALLASPFGSLLSESFQRFGDRDFTAQMCGVDLLTYLPGDILTKVDRMSMAVSLEARVPLLDNNLVDFALSLPSEFKFRDGEGKWILRRAIEGLVPDSVLRRPKQGFAMPVREWLTSSLRSRLDSLVAPTARIGAYTDRNAVLRLRNEHLRGRRDHSAALWRLLVLERWLTGHAEGATASPIQLSGVGVLSGALTVQPS